jgi:hypothetical protein
MKILRQPTDARARLLTWLAVQAALRFLLRELNRPRDPWVHTDPTYHTADTYVVRELPL